MTTIRINENVGIDTNIGDPIKATDDDNKDLVGTQTLTFVIDKIQRRQWDGAKEMTTACCSSCPPTFPVCGDSFFQIVSSMDSTTGNGYGQLKITAGNIPNYEEVSIYRILFCARFL